MHVVILGIDRRKAARAEEAAGIMHLTKMDRGGTSGSSRRRRKAFLTAGWDIALVAVAQGADVMFAVVSGPAWIFLGIGIMAVSTIAAYSEEIDAWWTKRQGKTARPQTLAVEGAMTAEEVKRLRQVSDAILSQVNREYQLTQAEHLAICGMLEIAKAVFEKHNIPHPGDDGDYSSWFRVISAVIARAEDVASARRAAQRDPRA